MPAGLTEPYDLVEGESDSGGEDHRRHGTGVVGAAIGSVHGTAPDAWVVFVPRNDPSGYAWVAEQPWIDVATVSAHSLETSPEHGVLPCRAAPHVRAFTRDRVFFASSGNVEHSSLYMMNGMPEFHLVGSVDDSGSSLMRPRPPASTDDEELFFALARYGTRTYETGDRFEFPAAGSDSTHGTEPFGGTSGATPSTAGRAADVITAARTILGDTGNRPRAVLALRGPDVVAPPSGPLADGDLTAAELTDLLHAVAVPQLETPGRYLVEGYGALGDEAEQRAIQVLRGAEAMPDRSSDDADHARSEQARARASAARGC